MTTVAFKQHEVVDGCLDLTIEEMYRALGEYAGLHLFSFDDEIADTFEEVDDAVWGSVSEGTWGVNSDSQLEGTGGGGAQWYWLLSQEDVPASFVLQVDKYSERGAIAFLAEDADNLYYVSWTSTACKVAKIVLGVEEVLCSLPKTDYAGECALTLSVQRDKYGHYISLWADDDFVVNAYTSVGLGEPETGADVAGAKIGFGVYLGETVLFDNLRIAELTEVLPIVTIDVGETPLGALQRAIGRRHINYFCRWNGELRAWRPKAQTAKHIYTADEGYLFNEQIDRRGLISHWRQIGAWDVADAWDEDLLQNVGHKFHKDDNPDLMTQGECQTEAEQSLIRSKEYAHTIDLEAPLNVFLEPEDRVTVRDGDWILTAYSLTLRGGELTLSGQMREYTYE